MNSLDFYENSTAMTGFNTILLTSWLWWLTFIDHRVYSGAISVSHCAPEQWLTVAYYSCGVAPLNSQYRFGRPITLGRALTVADPRPRLDRGGIYGFPIYSQWKRVACSRRSSHARILNQINDACSWICPPLPLERFALVSTIGVSNCLYSEWVEFNAPRDTT